MPERLSKRGGVWYFVRRVPPEFVEFDPREIVRLSTKVRVRDDRAGVKAGRAAAKLEVDLEATWKAAAGHQSRGGGIHPRAGRCQGEVAV